MLDLSLLVCTKNSGESIITCLESSLPILKAGAELVIVDAKSSDNTVNLIFEFIKMNNINYYNVITQLNKGLYEAFNLAINYSTRNKIIFLHSDDFLKDSKTLIRDVRDTSADVIFYGIEIKGTFFKRKWHIENIGRLNVMSMFIPPHAGIMVSRHVYSRIGEFRTDYKIAGDFEWMLRLLCSNNISFYFSNEVTYIMKSGGISNSGLASEITKFKEDLKALKSHGFKFAIYRVIRKKINKIFQFSKT